MHHVSWKCQIRIGEDGVAEEDDDEDEEEEEDTKKKKREVNFYSLSEVSPKQLRTPL